MKYILGDGNVQYEKPIKVNAVYVLGKQSCKALSVSKHGVQGVSGPTLEEWSSNGSLYPQQMGILTLKT